MTTHDQRRVAAWMARHGIDGGADPIGALLAHCEVMMVHQAKYRELTRKKQPNPTPWNDELEEALIELYNRKPKLSLPLIAKKMGFEEHQIKTKLRRLQYKGVIQQRKANGTD